MKNFEIFSWDHSMIILKNLLFFFYYFEIDDRQIICFSIIS